MLIMSRAATWCMERQEYCALSGLTLNRLQATGVPAPVVTLVRGSLQGLADFGVSRNGTLAYATGTGEEHRRLVWVDRQGVKNPSAQSPELTCTRGSHPTGLRRPSTFATCRVTSGSGGLGRGR
jgi:hypothetical protein